MDDTVPWLKQMIKCQDRRLELSESNALDLACDAAISP